MATQAVIAIAGLGDDPLPAAATFHAVWLPKVEVALAAKPDDLVLVFDPADHTHREWRLAAVRGLARAQAPRRINGLAGEGAAVGAALAWLDRAPGVTGQYLALDGAGAGDPVG